MRDAATLFKQELVKRNYRPMTPNLSRFVGMMERNLESIYDFPPSTSYDTDSEPGFKGSYHPMRECNMLHVS